MIKKTIIVEKDRKIIEVVQDFGFSYSDVNKLLRNRDVKLNGRPVKENLIVRAGDEVVFYYSAEMLEKKFRKIFEDGDVVVVFKNVGIETEGERGLEGVLSAMAVHRLDRNTEGLMVFAKNFDAKKKLEIAIKKDVVHKFYLAEVVGKFQTERKVFKAYLQKDSDSALVKIFQNPAKGAVPIETAVTTVSAKSESSLLEVELLTGKTHQIRAHLAYLGHPIIGDGKYGKNEINKKFKQKTQKLCCFKLKFDYIGIEGLNFKEFLAKPRF